MTHMQPVVAVIVIGLLVAIGYGVLRILRDTSFLARVVLKGQAEADAYEARRLDKPVEEYEAPAAMGFHRPRGD